MTSDWTQRMPGYSRLQGVCPYIDWALGSGAAGFFPPDQKLRVPVMLRLNGIRPHEFATGEKFFTDAEARKRWQNEVRVPAIYTHPDWSTRERIVCTAVVTRWFFDLLEAREDIRAYVERITLGLPLREESLPKYQSWTAGTTR